MMLGREDHAQLFLQSYLLYLHFTTWLLTDKAKFICQTASLQMVMMFQFLTKKEIIIPYKLETSPKSGTMYLLLPLLLKFLASFKSYLHLLRIERTRRIYSTTSLSAPQ